MNIAKLLIAAGVAAISLTAIADTADARRNRNHHHHDHWEDWNNRLDARRAGIIAGTAAAGITGAAARENASDHYRECMDYYDSDDRYERYCRDEYYRDQSQARRRASRVGVVVGLGVREIVRD